jgi:hypothetical protein
MRRVTLLLPALALLTATACSSSSSPTAEPSRSPAPTVAATTSTAAAGLTVWVCRPGGPDDRCTQDLDATVVGRGGTTTRAAFVPATEPRADCFYVYPTVSRAAGDNAPLEATPEVVSTVRAQAALFGSVCRVFAPVYRQVTTTALAGGRYFDQKAQDTAYADVVSAWHDYLNHDNGGRPFVLIGHSQGAMQLTRLVKSEIDGNPSLRARMLSAILLGGNVSDRDFRAVPPCRRAGQTGCVIAYSSFAAPPKGFTLFGRSGIAGAHVLCTDPTALAGAPGLLHPYVPADRVTTGPAALPGTGFVAYPDELRASCRASDGIVYLLVTPLPGVHLPTSSGALGPAWGLHVADVTLALGDLVTAVRRQVEQHPKG